MDLSSSQPDPSLPSGVGLSTDVSLSGASLPGDAFYFDLVIINTYLFLCHMLCISMCWVCSVIQSV